MLLTFHHCDIPYLCPAAVVSKHGAPVALVSLFLSSLFVIATKVIPIRRRITFADKLNGHKYNEMFWKELNRLVDLTTAFDTVQVKGLSVRAAQNILMCHALHFRDFGGSHEKWEENLHVLINVQYGQFSPAKKMYVY
jgi:hypothetical protein